MTKNRRGGYRQPSKPAAVATPQGGQRTDGGAGSSKQPLLHQQKDLMSQ